MVPEWTSYRSLPVLVLCQFLSSLTKLSLIIDLITSTLLDPILNIQFFISNDTEAYTVRPHRPPPDPKRRSPYARSCQSPRRRRPTPNYQFNNPNLLFPPSTSPTNTENPIPPIDCPSNYNTAPLRMGLRRLRGHYHQRNQGTQRGKLGYLEGWMSRGRKSGGCAEKGGYFD